MSASTLRRKRIIQDAQNPQPFIVNTYEGARDCVADYLISENMDAEIILATIEELRSSEKEKPMDVKNAKLCIEALNRFLMHSGALDGQLALTRSKGPLSAKKLNFGTVEISVQPEVLLRTSYRGKQVLGAIKLLFRKNGGPTPEVGTDVATLLKLHLEEVKNEDEVVLDKYCIVLDVFTGAMYPPAKAVKRKLQEVEAACEEIANRWQAGIVPEAASAGLSWQPSEERHTRVQGRRVL